MKTTLDFLLDGAQVRRFHTRATVATETVGHHSHGVATIALLLDPDASRDLIIAALYHDLSEHVTGDIPSPMKREYGISAQISDIEEKLMLQAGITFPTLSEKDQRTLKLADIAHGAIFCCQELELGNLKMRNILDTYLSYAHDKVLVGREQQLFSLIEEMSDDVDQQELLNLLEDMINDREQ